MVQNNEIGETPSVADDGNNVASVISTIDQEESVTTSTKADVIAINPNSDSNVLDENQSKNLKSSCTKVNGREEMLQAEILEELAHPDAVFITEEQFKLDRACAEAAIRAHVEGITVNLQVAQTIFYLSSFHFKEEHNSMKLYNDPSGTPRRLEWVDFVRRGNDEYVLYLWDQRNAIMLSLLDADTNKYQTRFFVAMTNLYMHLGDGSVSKDLVLLDILVRMDAKTYVDALVGVIATGEVKLWKHSQHHLRFLHCDYMHKIEKGEDFWIARREQFYSDKGLIYLPQRMVPRDLDAPRTRFAISKEYITHYKHPYKTHASVAKNFNKWTLLPGRFKSLKEYAEMTSETIDRHGTLAAANAKEIESKKAISDANQKVQDEINRRRQDTRRKNKEEKKKDEERKLLEKHQRNEEARREEESSRKTSSSKPKSNSKPAAAAQSSEGQEDLVRQSKTKTIAKAPVIIIEDRDELSGCTSLKRAASAISRDKGILAYYQKRSCIIFSLPLKHSFICDKYNNVIEEDDVVLGSRNDTQAKFDLLVQQREERRLRHMEEMHKIEEEERKAQLEYAQSRADAKKKKEAADLEEVKIA